MATRSNSSRRVGAGNRRIEVKWLDSIPLWMLGIGAVLFALAPFGSEPHLIQKLNMLATGTLHRPIDIFDLVFHASLPLLLLLKVGRLLRRGQPGGGPR